MIEGARQSSAEEIEPARSDRAFYQLPCRKKLVVMLGGPTMNLFIATVLFTIALVGVGVADADDHGLDAVADCVLTAAVGAECAATDPHEPGGGGRPAGRRRRGRDRRSAGRRLGRQPVDQIRALGWPSR